MDEGKMDSRYVKLLMRSGGSLGLTAGSMRGGESRWPWKGGRQANIYALPD